MMGHFPALSTISPFQRRLKIPQPQLIWFQTTKIRGAVSNRASVPDNQNAFWSNNA
jgi:hypothetical protein